MTTSLNRSKSNPPGAQGNSRTAPRRWINAVAAIWHKSVVRRDVDGAGERSSIIVVAVGAGVVLVEEETAVEIMESSVDIPENGRNSGGYSFMSSYRLWLAGFTSELFIMSMMLN